MKKALLFFLSGLFVATLCYAETGSSTSSSTSTGYSAPSTTDKDKKDIDPLTGKPRKAKKKYVAKQETKKTDKDKKAESK